MELARRGKIKDVKLRKRYAKAREGEFCFRGCGRLGQQVCHILRGANKTDEWWNYCWLCQECHTKFDSKGIKTRVWMFDVLIARGQCSVRDILLAQFRFHFEH